MDLFFWRTLNKYRPRFLTLLDIQGIPFDPMVNKYLEAEQTDKIQRTAAGSTTTDQTGTRNGTTTSDTTDNGSTTDEGSTARLHSEDASTASGGERHSEQATAENGGRTDTAKDGRTTTGSRLNDGTSSANRSEQGTSDETAAANGGGTEYDTNNSTSKSQTDDRTREAQKAAPMNASNIPAQAGDGTRTLSGNHIGDLDFEYASNYGQRDAGHLSNSEDNGTSNKATTTEESRATHGATQGVSSENGTTSDRETTQGQEDANRDNAALDEKSGATSGSERNAENSTETRAGREAEQDKRTSQHENKIGNTTTNADTDKLDSTTKRQDQENTARVNRNRLTGRDGLTPQEAMKTSEEYLRKIGPAIQYLIDVLEICFIGIYDL